MAFLTWMGDHPILTVTLCLVLATTIVSSIDAFSKRKD